MPILTFLIGPTAVGKTALGVAWAKKIGGEILYADAPCIFKGMDIGTAKPTVIEREEIPHHGIDWAELSERFTVGDYAARAAKVVAEVTARGKPLLILGGSGFYLRSFFEPATDGLGIDKAVSEAVAELECKSGPAAVLARLRACHSDDPLTGLDLRNPRRVSKALERVLSSGKPYRELKASFDSLPKPFEQFDKRIICLGRHRDDLAARISARATSMINGGLIDEVRALMKAGLCDNPQAASAIDYRETIDFLEGRIPSLKALHDAIVKDSLLLVRKQLTFFKLLPVSKTITLEPHQTADLNCFEA